MIKYRTSNTHLLTYPLAQYFSPSFFVRLLLRLPTLRRSIFIAAIRHIHRPSVEEYRGMLYEADFEIKDVEYGIARSFTSREKPRASHISYTSLYVIYSSRSHG